MTASSGGRTIAVVLNYRTADQTILAVRSLQASATRVAHIIVVDNASGDGSAADLAAALDGIQLIEETVNGGFSAGCNVGIREALRFGADRVLLLNPDVTLSATAIGILERALAGDAQLGIVGPAIVSDAHKERVESLGIRYSTRTGRMRHHGFGTRVSTLIPFKRRTVDAVSGGVMLVRRDVFDRVGLLAEEYFFGFEDIDFCLRARDAGFQSACVGEAVVRHLGQASIGGRSGRRIYFATRNHLLLARRCSPLRSGPARWLQTTSILGLNLAHALLTAKVPRMAGLRGFFEGARDHFAGRYGDSPPAPQL